VFPCFPCFPFFPCCFWRERPLDKSIFSVCRPGPCSARRSTASAPLRPAHTVWSATLTPAASLPQRSDKVQGDFSYPKRVPTGSPAEVAVPSNEEERVPLAGRRRRRRGDGGQGADRCAVLDGTRVCTKQAPCGRRVSGFASAFGADVSPANQAGDAASLQAPIRCASAHRTHRCNTGETASR